MSEKKSVHLMDVEVFKHMFQAAIKDFVTKEVTSWEVSEERDERKEMYQYFSKFNHYMVTFNGIYYDNLVIAYFIDNYKRLKKLPWQELCAEMKVFSDLVIDRDNNFDKLKKYVWFKHPWESIDLFCYWAKSLRISKKISLKSLGIQLHYPVVETLPFDPSYNLKKEDLPIIRHYNNVHDLGILDYLTEAMREEIKLRFSIRDQYNLPCLSWDAPKIASEALLSSYCTATGQDAKEIRNKRFSKPYMPIKDILGDFDPKFELPIFKELYEDMQNSYNSYDREITVIHGTTSIRLAYGIGGLHSVNENESYESSSTHKILTSDFASLYPNLIINYKTIRYPEVLDRYAGIKAERLIVKKDKSLKTQDLFLKLILNGTSGLLDQEYSWLYYPEGALRLRLIGQLILTKVAEAAILKGWQVISANTDGIEVIVPIEDVDEYKRITEQIATDFNLELEHEEYQKIIYKNVNNYIGVMASGSIKRKGFFKLDYNEKGQREIPLGDSVNELVIPRAFNLYFTKGIPVEESVMHPEKYGFHIYDYCASKKIAKNYGVFYNGKKTQNLNRYYFSSPAPYLLKKKQGKDTFEHINAGDPVLLFNEFENKPWDEYKLNFKHYTTKAKEVINEIEASKRQLSLF